MPVKFSNSRAATRSPFSSTKGQRTCCPIARFSTKNTRFFVILSGAVEIVQQGEDGEVPVVVHGPGQFTGEINMLSARRSLVRARGVLITSVLYLPLIYGLLVLDRPGL